MGTETLYQFSKNSNAFFLPLDAIQDIGANMESNTYVGQFFQDTVSPNIYCIARKWIAKI